MSITKSELKTIIDNLEVNSTAIAINEISFWESYRLPDAYDAFWGNEYLNMYLYMLKHFYDLFETETELYDFTDLTVDNINPIFQYCKEIVYFNLKVPYEFLS